MSCRSVDEASQRPGSGVEAREHPDEVWNYLDKDERWSSLGDGKPLDGVISWESRLDSKRRARMKDKRIQFLLETGRLNLSRLFVMLTK